MLFLVQRTSCCHPCLDSLHPLVNPSLSSFPLSSSITPSLFHSRLKTYLFNKSFPPYISFTYWTAFSWDWTGRMTLISLFLVSHFTFSFRPIPCGGLATRQLFTVRYGPFIATQLNSTRRRVASSGLKTLVALRRRRYRHFADATQLDVELTCVAINGPVKCYWSLYK